LALSRAGLADRVGSQKMDPWISLPLPQKILDFFHSKIVHLGASSYTNSKVLFAMKCREKYIIAVFLAIDTDMKTSSFHQSRKLIPTQSVSSNSRRFHSYSRLVLFYMSCKRKLHCRATIGQWCAED